MTDNSVSFDHSLKTLLEKRFAYFVSPLESFIHKQTTSSILLVLFTIISLIIANTGWRLASETLYQSELGVTFGDQHFALSLAEWVSQGLMALFFFLTGLEVKREILAGKLRQAHEVRLVILAAIGGIVVPALLYSLINQSGPGQHGWGIPTATDTAFAIGILALLAGRVSLGMAIFLTALSIFDDIGAILIISVFYAQHIEPKALGMAFFVMLLLFSANRIGIRYGWVYVVLGVALWICVYRAGIHATCAGLLLAAMVPARASISQLGFIRNVKSLIRRLEQRQNDEVKMLESSGQHSLMTDIGANVRAASTPLQRWQSRIITPIAIIVLPLFALFNGGLPLSTELFATGIKSTVTLGIILGLVVGKPFGIILFALAGLKLKIGALPRGVSLRELIGVALLSGIGFTMSIFFATLSFSTDSELIEVAKLGILIASLLSAVAGSIWIYFMHDANSPNSD